jgi:lipopolysaccharide transport system permease protein
MDAAMTKASPFPLRSRERALVWELAKREVAGRYRGATLGVVWSLLQPFLMLGVYTLAFGEILKARWPGAGDTGSFAMILFVGIIVHGFFAECLSKAPLLVAGNANYVKRIVFPLEVLPWPTLLSAAFHFVTNLLVLLLFLAVLGKPIHVESLLLPLILLPLAILGLGCMWMLSAVAVYFRDVNQIMGPVVTALFFLSSAVVPVQSLPTKYQQIFNLNPLTPVIDQARIVVLEGSLPDFWMLFVQTGLSLVVFLVGFAVFRKLRAGFADVL